MASSRASSPSGELMSNSPMHLTPRSKVKAMLAALDDDSDNSGENAISVSYSPSTKLSAAISTEDPFLNNSVAEALSAENEEEDEEVVKPRGRLAARMLTVQSDVFDDHSTETARDRVRRMLLAEQQKEPENSRTHHITSDESEDNRVPVKSRKRKMMKLRKSTPQSSPTKSNDESREGLFVSPSRHRSSSQRSNNSSSEDDLPNNPNTNPRFIALIARKREERLAKDAEAERQKAERAARYHEELDDEVEDGDDEAGRRLTQQARPTRKAGKKALEEMHRETQRMSRNMQLAHEARTRKKITKSSLFAKFNYKPAGLAEDEVDLVENRSSSPASHTDADMKDTPPTSPLSDTGNPRKTYNAGANHHATRTELPYSSENNGDNMDHPTFQQAIFSSPPPLASKTDKGKGKSVIEPYSDILVQSVRIRDPSPVTKYFQLPKITASQDDDSDSDLDIIAAQTPLPKTKKDSIFDRVPAKQAKESHSLHALRMLAHLTSPGNQANRRNAKPSITATEMQFSLQQLARQQATREREERLQNLRDRGVIVQTAQEREQELAEVEDLMAKARREGEEIMKREKDAAKKQRKLNGEEDPLGECSDDDDWQEEKEASTDEHSGSSSENEDDEGDMSVDEEEKGRETDKSNLKSQLIDNEASESEVSDTERDSVNNTEAANLNDDDEEMGPTVQPRRRMQHRILSDDEDDEVVSVAESPVAPRTVSPASRHIRSPVAPLSVLRSATKTFIPGLTVSGPAGLGLTQIFAGTMDDSQTQDFLASNFRPHSPSQQIDGAEDSLAFLRRLPAPKLPKFEPTMDDDSQDIVMDSQTQISQIPGSQPAEDTSQGIQLQFSQSQVHEFDTPMLDFPATQYSEYPTPTQDAGFQTMSPIKGRFVEPPPSTIETVVLHATPALERVKDSPVTKKKGRLQRRAPVVAKSEDDEPQGDKQTTANNDDEFDISANVFDAMRNASRKKVTINDFNKKKSGAKEMVHEQAEESEDEYAGLGGNSDDESGGEEDEFVRQMIDDEGGKDVDESALAAFYADKERLSDEKQVERLFKDITNGTLRRKRGADYDLSDSDDDGEARRRMKRKEFAKMRKALLEDERIGKIAENPKRLAFLRAIEDRGDNDDVDFLADFDDSQSTSDSQSQSQTGQQDVIQVNSSQPTATMGPPKRKLGSDTATENRLPPHLRRTKAGKKPSNLSEIRESLSSLIEEPNAMVQSHDFSDSESDLEIEGDMRNAQKEKENRDPFAPRRRKSHPVVDRISLKRASSSSVSTSVKLAFAASTVASAFKVPALLRRATTNSSITSGSGSSVSGTERMSGAFGDDGKTAAKKATKSSGVNYFARENERRVALKEGEKRREQKRFKGAEGRRKAVGGLFGNGKFE